jgi:hypothetical protein
MAHHLGHQALGFGFIEEKRKKGKPNTNQMGIQLKYGMEWNGSYLK